jgi:hypothetical protein
MHLLPADTRAERETSCGGFLTCLESGDIVSVVGSQDDLKRIGTLVDERFQKQLSVVRELETAHFTLYHIQAD